MNSTRRRIPTAAAPSAARGIVPAVRNSIRLAAITLFTALVTSSPATAAEPGATTTTTVKGAAPPNLKAVVDGFQKWLLTFSTALAVLALTVAGVFYLFSAGNPAQVERAKLILRATVIGYSLMVLAPLVLTALQGIVGS